MIENFSTEALYEELIKRKVLESITTNKVVEELCKRDDISETEYYNILQKAKLAVLLECLHERTLDEVEVKKIIENCCNNELEFISDIDDAIEYIEDNNYLLNKKQISRLENAIDSNISEFDTLPKKTAFNVFLEKLKTENPYHIIKKLQLRF